MAGQEQHGADEILGLIPAPAGSICVVAHSL